MNIAALRPSPEPEDILQDRPIAAGERGGPTTWLATLRRFAVDLLGSAGRDVWKAAALVFAGALVEGIGLLLLLPLLSVLLGAESGGGMLESFSRQILALAPGSGTGTRLVFLLALFGALIALRSIVIVKRDVLIARLQIRFVQDRRSRIIKELARSRWDVVARLRHGRVTHILGSDIHALRTATHFLIQAGVSVVMLLGHALLAFLLSPVLAGMLVLLMVGGAVALRPVLERSRRLGAKLTSANLTLVSDTTQFLGGLKLALSQDLQGAFVDEFEEVQRNAAARELDFARQRALTQAALLGLSAALAAGAVIVGLMTLGTSLPVLLALLAILARMNGPASQIQQGAQQVFHSLPAYRTIKDLEEELAAARRPEPEIGRAANACIEGRIVLTEVAYAHPGAAVGVGKGGLRNVDLAIDPGSFVGIAGPSGAGKTTLADLLVGLYPPQFGRVEVAGMPLAGEVLAAWRRSISYVSQDPFLFHDSVRENLRWACPHSSEAELWDVIDKAGARDILRRAEHGLDTIVGERGMLLSGGERQRIALARALLRRPRFLLLDEATNAIDVEGEAELLRMLTSLQPRPTIVMIAHREASLALCDRLIELSDGRIVRDWKP